MADFVNTIDVLGDGAVFDSIIDRTITEFKDDKVQSIGYGAFHGCKSLVTIDLPNATTDKGLAFANCAALAEVNLPLLANVGEQMFRGCKSLKTISLPSLKGGTGYLAFDGCSLLESISIPLATEVGVYSIQGCAALKEIDLPSVKKICSGGLHCNNLETVALRYNGVCTLENTNAFGTKIQNGEGYIYVPSALYDSYRSAANWSTFANQFRKLEEWTVDGTVTGAFDTNRHMVRFFNEDGTFLGYVIVPTGGMAGYTGDTPEKEGDWEFIGWKPDPIYVTEDMDCYAQFKSNSIYTWEAVAAACADGTYKDVYAIGDFVPIDLGDYGVHDMQIVAFDADTKPDGAKAAITWMSQDVIVKRAMNSTADNTNGWAASEMRTWLQTDFYDILPSEVKSSIVTVNKTYYDYTSASMLTCEDNVWIPSSREMVDVNGFETSGATYTGYFTNDATRVKRYGNNPSVYWLRSASSRNDLFRSVSLSGSSHHGPANIDNGVVLGFCT